MSIFSKIERTNVKSNTFDLTHDVKLSAKFGTLTPICVMDTIPGDKFKISGNAMVRLAPMIAPVMHRANVYMHYFFVPNRILWNNWENFITGGREGTDTSVHPTIPYSTNQAVVGSLLDYMGLPTDQDTVGGITKDINALPFAAYQKIYNDYFRDQNFIPEVVDTLTDGDNAAIYADLRQQRQRAWRHDYFTSALPWTQRGPEVLLPLGETAPIETISDTDTYQFMRQPDGTPINGQDQLTLDILDGGTLYGNTTAPVGGGYFNTEETHQVDLSAATASSIRDLRRAFKLQEWLEKNARGGSRYIEQMQVHFGVHSSDKRLQRAEYIGGFKSPIKFSEVLQTSASNSDVQQFDTPQGNMAGHGISVGGSKPYTYYCEEHGYIIGLLSVLPDTAYQQGIPKHFLRDDKFDYPFPSFAHIGEQEILNCEIYADDTANPEDVWGYIPRYAEMKFISNRVAGTFRTNQDIWHMGRKFAALPPLNQSFVEMQQSEVSRIFAVDPDVTSTPPLWVQVLNQVTASRKLPIFGTPHM